MKLDLKLGQLNENSKYSLLLLGSIIIFAAVLWLLVSPLRADTAKNSALLLTQSQKLAAYQTFAQQNKDYTNFEVEQRLKLQKAQIRLPDLVSIPDVLKDYTGKAKQADVTLLSVKAPRAEEIKQESAAFAVPVTIKITGNYYKIVDFLQRVENGDRFAKLQQVNVTGNESNGDVTVDAKLQVYSMKKGLNGVTAKVENKSEEKTGVERVKAQDKANMETVNNANNTNNTAPKR